jgi:hypothetical protein
VTFADPGALALLGLLSDQTDGSEALGCAYRLGFRGVADQMNGLVLDVYDHVGATAATAYDPLEPFQFGWLRPVCVC